MTLKILNFSDDTLLYTTFKKHAYIQNINKLYLELKNVSDELIVNKLKEIFNKTRYMLFHPVKTNFKKKNKIFEVKICKTNV